MFGGIWRPRVDVPEFTRCCFCLPLRYGLLAWGYLKVMGLSLIAYINFHSISMLKHFDIDISPMLIIFLIAVILDLLCTAIFIVGGHLKHRLLYKMYYYYSICFLISFVLLFIANLIDEISELQDRVNDKVRFVISYLISYLYTATPIIVIQGYVTLLVRSELLKLSSSNFEFTNNAAQATNIPNELTP